MKKNMKKRLLSGLLCLVMTLTQLPTAAMAAGRFTDVTEKDWFYADVEYAMELGLVNGMTATTYSPGSNLTYGAAIKLAACMHRKVTQGNTDFTVGSPWYQVYVDYAAANGIILAGRTYDWNANATRAGYMEIFANAIPDTGLKNGYTELSAMNRVDDGAIPDVSMTHPQAAAIYKLYRAGILQGNDAAHNCNPNGYIRRSEVAAILTRMMDASKRITFEMAASGESDSANELTVTQQPADAAAALGEKAQFTVEVSGGKSPYTYKWYSSADGAGWTAIVNSSQYSGCATATLTVKTNASTPLYYRCEITDATHGSVTSNAARLSVGASTLTVSQQPQDVTCKADEWVSFSVAVSGGKTPYTYQWQMMSDTEEWYDLCDNYGFTGTDSATLKAKATKQNFDFHCQHRCRITDANGSVVYSDIARATEQTGSTPTRPGVSVSGGLTITKQPENASAPIDEKVTFTVEISGGKSPYACQWQYSTDGGDTWLPVANSTKYGGVSSTTLTVKIDGTDNSGRIYRCKISDAAHTEVCSNSVIASWQRPTVAG